MSSARPIGRIAATVIGGVLFIGYLIEQSFSDVPFRAKLSHVQAVARSLDLAMVCYSSEYGGPPEIASRSFDTASPEGIALLKLLSNDGRPNDGSGRNLNFLNLPIARDHKGGLAYDSNGRITGLLDPWGHPYLILFPAAPGAPISLPDGSSMTAKDLIMLSPGRDDKFGTADDIIPAAEARLLRPVLVRAAAAYHFLKTSPRSCPQGPSDI